MSSVNSELINRVKSFGYKVDFGDGFLRITSKNSSSILLTILSIIIGIALFPLIGGDPKGIILILLMIFYPILTFRRNAFRKTTLYYNDSILYSSSKALIPVKKTFLLNNSQIEFREFQRNSYTTALDSSNLEFFADIQLALADEFKLELFHFSSRNKETLNFARELAERIKSVLGEGSK